MKAVRWMLGHAWHLADERDLPLRTACGKAIPEGHAERDRLPTNEGPLCEACRAAEVSGETPDYGNTYPEGVPV